jgi:hypothetical protein
MSLTVEAIDNRKWEHLPNLRRIFSKSDIPDRFFRPTSITDTSLEREYRFQQIVSVIWKDDGKFLEDVSVVNVEEIDQELEELLDMAKHFAELHMNEAKRLEEFFQFVLRLGKKHQQDQTPAT